MEWKLWKRKADGYWLIHYKDQLYYLEHGYFGRNAMNRESLPANYKVRWCVRGDMQKASINWFKERGA